MSSQIGKKIDLIYIVPDDFNFKQIELGSDKENMIKERIFSPYYKNDFQTIMNGIDYLSLESINIFEKKKKENIKKLNREHLVTIFKCMGFNLIYCPQIAEKILNDLLILINIKFDTIVPEDYFTTSIVIKQSIFFDISKNVINNITDKSKCHLKKYFNLSYIIISKFVH
jgi:hypothetical protein